MEEEAEGESISEALQEELNEQIEAVPEADKKYSCVRDNDTYEPIVANPDDLSSYNNVRNTVASSITGISRALDQALRVLTRSKKVRFMPRGKLDTSRLVAVAKGLDKRVFYRKEEGEKLDTVIGIIVDESGSMGRRIYDMQQLIAALGETLDKIGVKFEVIGSTTKYFYGDIPAKLTKLHKEGYDRTNPLRFKIYKTFGEQWNKTKSRITHMSSHKHNVDCEAVELMAKRLATRSEKRKIIFSLSDGRPDAGHDNSAVMGRFLKHVCARARQSGIEVYGFGVGTTEPERYYGKEHFIYLEKVEEMGHKFFRKFADIVTSGRFKA